MGWKQDRSRSFSEADLRILVRNDVPLEYARSFDERFDASDITSCHIKRFSPEDACAFPARFDELSIIIALQSGFGPEIGEGYDDRFTGMDVWDLFEAGISNERACEYPENMGANHIVECIRNHIPPGVVCSYASHFDGEDIAMLLSERIYPDEANTYPEGLSGYLVSIVKKNKIDIGLLKPYKRFSIREMVYLLEYQVPLEEAEAYPDRFSASWIGKYFWKKNILPQETRMFDERFSQKDVSDLCDEGISGDRANMYPARFSAKDIIELVEGEVSPEIAGSFVKGSGKRIVEELKYPELAKVASEYDMFSIESIVKLIEWDVSHGVANRYFKPREWDIMRIIEARIPPDVANAYHHKLSSTRVIEYVKKKISPEKTMAYHPSFTDADIADFITNDISPDTANAFARFRHPHGGHALALIQSGVPVSSAHSFPVIFNGKEVREFYRRGMTVEEVKGYSPALTGEQILLLHQFGIHPDTHSRLFQMRLAGLLERILVFPYNNLHSNFFFDPYLKSLQKMTNAQLFNEGGYTFIDSGAQGVLLMKEGSAWKFSKDIKKEYVLLQKVNEHFNGGQRHIIKVWDPDPEATDEYPIDDLAIRMEYVTGRTLDQVVRERDLSADEVIGYGYQMLEGLVEMRAAGIVHHRDLRPANIMVEDGSGRIVIIDLGIATVDRNALPKDNRRFGGAGYSKHANDLVSLGVIMYKMATGEHLFASDPSMERTTFADGLKHGRDLAFETPGGLDPYLKKVEENIQDERVQDLIKACLTAKNFQYKKMMKIFERTIR